MTQVKDIMLPIRLPAELKYMFQTLCKTRGVSVSAELRRLMIQEISQSAIGIIPEDGSPQVKKITPAKKKPIQKKVKPAIVENREPSRCNDTVDMFGNSTGLMSARFGSYATEQAVSSSITSNNDVDAKPELSDAAKSAMKASKSRKKTKSRKKK